MRTHRELVYPQHHFQPEDLLTFIELPLFAGAWSSLGLTDDDLLKLQCVIMAMPKGSPVIQGCGGLRKLRFAPGGSSKGKRGSFRACYVYFEEYHKVVLVVVYPKSQKEDLSADEKRRIRVLIHALKEDLDKPSV